ncbi:hypothetical protein ACH41H_44135 [Streptomyces sp. NPDC020800]|uniref:hypothetical protein n=1 Tax=Streptomyces sp. NPDC020800 TaxID=3365092 RepID=UPI0037A7D3FC
MAVPYPLGDPERDGVGRTLREAQRLLTVGDRASILEVRRALEWVRENVDWENPWAKKVASQCDAAMLRTIWSGAISFGLVTVPCNVFTRVLEDGSLTGFGPTVLRTGDDVRHFYNWTVTTQDRAQAVHVDVSTLRIIDITLTHCTREIQLADLPDDFTASLMSQLETEGLCWVPVHEHAGTYPRVPLADGSDITISGATAGGRGEASSQHPAHNHGGWLAVWGTSMAPSARSTALPAGA